RHPGLLSDEFTDVIAHSAGNLHANVGILASAIVALVGVVSRRAVAFSGVIARVVKALVDEVLSIVGSIAGRRRGILHRVGYVLVHHDRFFPFVISCQTEVDGTITLMIVWCALSRCGAAVSGVRHSH